MPRELIVISITAIVVLVVLGTVLWQMRKQRRFSGRLAEALGARRPEAK